MRVMIVDDEADIREIFSFNLSAAGYDTIECGTAEAALIQIRKGTVHDIILLDVMLPGMSGFKLADKIRKEDGCNVPIIFLTARNAENDLLTGFSAGGDDYISKPFSVNEVLARIKKDGQSLHEIHCSRGGYHRYHKYECHGGWGSGTTLPQGIRHPSSSCIPSRDDLLTG